MTPIDLEAIRKALDEHNKPVPQIHVSRAEFEADRDAPRSRAWRESADLIVDDPDGSQWLVLTFQKQPVPVPVSELVAIAELQTRALLAVEWGRHGLRENGRARYYWAQCPACFDPPEHGEKKHKAACPLDAALTACGLDTQEKRDAARQK